MAIIILFKKDNPRVGMDEENLEPPYTAGDK